MSKRSFLFILCTLLLSCSLCGTLAEESRTVVWRVTDPVINMEALQTETFGADLSSVREEQRGAKWRKDRGGPETHGHKGEVQDRISQRTHA